MIRSVEQTMQIVDNQQKEIERLKTSESERDQLSVKCNGLEKTIASKDTIILEFNGQIDVMKKTIDEMGKVIGQLEVSTEYSLNLNEALVKRLTKVTSENFNVRDLIAKHIWEGVRKDECIDALNGTIKSLKAELCAKQKELEEAMKFAFSQSTMSLKRDWYTVPK